MKRLLLVILLVFGGAPAWADVVYLENGRVLSGVQTEVAAAGLRVLLPEGSLLLRSAEVRRVERTSPRPSAAGELRSELRALAGALEAAWRAGDTERARRLLAGSPSARVLTAPGVTTRARLVRTAGGVLLRVSAKRASSDPLLLALPPGTRAGGAHGVVLLRPAALVIEPGQREAHVTLPVAWAHPAQRPPVGRALLLSRAGSDDLQRLLAVLCAGEDTPDEVSAQLAVWLLRDRLRPADLVAFGPRLTVSRRLVLPLHGERAARHLRAAGLDPRRLGFFRDEPLPALPPLSPARGASSS